MKHEILLYYKQILKIAGNLFDNDLIQYMNQKFINKLSKGDYYNFLRFTMYMWYYYMKHLNDNRIIYDKITYKQLRKWCLNNKLFSGSISIIFRTQWHRSLTALPGLQLPLLHCPWPTPRGRL